MRKLASVQVIDSVEPIEGADAIERVHVLGWWVVARKGEHAPGDRVVYCEIDSLLPERPELEFLRKGCYKAPILVPATGQVLLPGGFRIKTIRLRGQVSQGICFPLSFLPAGTPTDVGADVTEALGIVKWEPPLPASLHGRVKGPFPSFVPKTDEPRVQVVGGVLTRHRGKTFYLTEKLDGTSFTAFVSGDAAGVCGRNQWLDETDLDNTMCRLVRELDLLARLRKTRDEIGFDLAVQGELIGPGIQKNRYALKAPRLTLFNVVNLSAYRLEDHASMLALSARIGIEPVPQLGTLVLDHTVDELVELSGGPSALNPATPREGIVLRPLRDETDPEIGRLSFKVVNPKFLLKFDD